MGAVLEFIATRIREDLGQPASLIKLIKTHEVRVDLPAPARSISSDSVVRWDLLGQTFEPWLRHLPEKGLLNGFRAQSGNHYGHFELTRSEYASLVRKEVADDWTCDITAIDGFSASRANLFAFRDTDQMAEKACRGLIDEVSHQRLAENLAHKGIQIRHKPGTSDHFTRYSWDGRLFVMNTDGSHHMAAAKYLAERLGVAVPMRATLVQYWLDETAIDSLCRDFEMFVISDDPAVACGFHDAMSSFRATWLWHSMPKPYENTRAILLPRSERRSMRVAEELRQAGVIDFGAYLSSLVVRDSAIEDQYEKCEADVDRPRPRMR